MEEKNHKNIYKIILIIVAVCAILGASYYSIITYQNTKKSTNQSNTTISKKVDEEDDEEEEEETASRINRKSDEKNLNITSGGSYDLSGTYESVTINTSDEVTLNLKDAEISCSDGPAINVEKAKKITISISGNNTITATTTEDLDGAIYSKADLVLTGSGSLELKSNYDGIVSKDTLVIENGTYKITSSDDAIRGKDSVEIADGTFNIDAGGDGIKASNDEDTSLGYVLCEGGTYTIKAKSDGIQGITKVTLIIFLQQKESRQLL